MRILMVLVIALTGGCATITRGTNQDFVVESTPAGASVRTSNGFECAATPCTFRMPRKDGFTVDVELEGYLPAHAIVTSDLSGGGAAGMAGNVLVGGLIGMGVDSMSGATQDLRPNPLQITLQLVPAPPAPAPAAGATDEEPQADPAQSAPAATTSQ